MATPKTAIQLIQDERQRQVTAEGYSAEYDDVHKDGAMADAAAVYAAAAGAITRGASPEELHSEDPDDPGEYHGVFVGFEAETVWPWEPALLKLSPDPIRNLIKAAALAVAEIERLQRSAGERPVGQPPTTGISLDLSHWRPYCQFKSFASWVAHAASWCGGMGHSNLFMIDMKGRPLFIGKDFYRAREDVAFPVIVYVRAEFMQTMGIESLFEKDPPAPPRSCRICGCTEDDCRGCIVKTGKPCHWVAEDLCSACEGASHGNP